MTPIERFWSKTKLDGKCLVWTAGTNGYGYGSFRLSNPRRRVAAHRWLYEQVFGPLAKGMVLMHSCDRGADGCVTLQHLSPGTQRQNIHECISRERFARGSRVVTAKLTDELVRLLRQLTADGWSSSRIGRLLGVASSTVTQVLRGETWKHVT